MIEALFAVGITGLAALGLALGLMLRGTPPRTACEGISCMKDVPCPGCPHQKGGRDA